MAVLKAAAQEPRVERIFVNPAIKKALCRDATGDRGWLHKVRPWPGHDYHFHIRISCPAGSPDCKPQPSVPASELGCGHDLDWWFKQSVLHPKPSPHPVTPRPGAPLSHLPAACRSVVMAP
jgi:penicillin-insensitive murein endopeptidase